jgi:pimeloyl-ACP methyl ester carboxylesterase
VSNDGHTPAVPSATPQTRALLLPGSGSDVVFLGRAFSAALAAVGVRAVALEPDPSAVAESGRRSLDEAAEEPGPLLVGGVSLGAAVAAGWALGHPGRAGGLLLALPAWWGAPAGAAAALLAAHSAERLRELGLLGALAEVDAGSPPWLAAELRRAWSHQWPHLPAALDEAAAHLAPTVTELATLEVPIGLVAAVDDPVHPVAVALELATAAPAVRLELVTLVELGADPGSLGRAAVRAWQQAGGTTG